MKKRIFLFAVLVLLTAVMPVQSKTAAVYVSAQGKKYHTQTCRTIAKAQTVLLDRTEAEKQGYTACKICKP